MKLGTAWRQTSMISLQIDLTSKLSLNPYHPATSPYSVSSTSIILLSSYYYLKNSEVRLMS